MNIAMKASWGMAARLDLFHPPKARLNETLPAEVDFEIDRQERTLAP